ncbi:hypothetical protein ACHQM5_005417 [Ranunculus cassubicifolius]
MSMPPGNVVISAEKNQQMQFQSHNNNGGGGGGNVVNGGGGEIYQRQWLMDERDRFISWLRGEFAAANAIIDCLCNHLRAIGEPGEYDVLMGCVQQRRVTWNPVLHMQQFFSIAEVTYALQQTAWKKQQQKNFDKVKVSDKEFKRSGSQGTRQWFRVENKENQNAIVENRSPGEVGSVKGQESVKHSEDDIKKVEDGKGDEKNSSLAEEKEGACNDLPKIGSNPIKKQDEEQSIIPIPKTFVGTEIVDGKTVNVVEGLKLYGELFDNLKISSIVQLTNELRSAGRRGQLKGHTFMASKRPMKGRGREVIQLGAPIADAAHEDEKFPKNYEDVEAIPSLLEDVIERLVSSQVVPVKPDSCVIDFFNEADHSQPHVCPNSFGRPVCVLFLTECDITFGKVIGAAHSGEYRGALKLSMSPGSVLSMQGNSSDIARHAIPSIRKQRIFITFTVSQIKKISPTDGQHLAPSLPNQPNPWGPPHSRPPHQTGHPRGGPKHFVPAATTGVLPIPHLPPPNNMPPIFIPSPVPPTMSYPTQVPRHPPPRLPLPGTGVFLPPSGSGQSPPSVVETPGSVRLNCNGTENGNALPKKSEPKSNGAIAAEKSLPVGNGYS